MSDKVRVFCETVHSKLVTLDSRMRALTLNTGATWNSLQQKLEEVRERGEASRQSTQVARHRLDQWCSERKLDAYDSNPIDGQSLGSRRLAERAQRAEDHTVYAIQIAVASIDEAERMILEAISARLEAESSRIDPVRDARPAAAPQSTKLETGSPRNWYAFNGESRR